jgi:hypothetical protein
MNYKNTSETNGRVKNDPVFFVDPISLTTTGPTGLGGFSHYPPL